MYLTKYIFMQLHCPATYQNHHIVNIKFIRDNDIN